MQLMVDERNVKDGSMERGQLSSLSGSWDWPPAYSIAISSSVSPRGQSEPIVPRWVRLQIALGAVPLAGYLSVHLLTQLSALWGPNAHVRWGGLPVSPGWIGLEMALIYIPWVVHVGLGVRRILRPVAAPVESGVSPLGRQFMRASGAVLLVFLLIHIAEWRLPLWMGQLVPSDTYPELCARLSSTHWGGVPLVALGHLLGVAAAAHHGAQGIYQGVLGLGLIGARRAGVFRRCCIALGFCWFGLGALIVIDLATGSVLIHLAGS
jgi:succinate dehydrogenase/fumarate reductase cytochrome b subunit